MLLVVIKRKLVCLDCSLEFRNGPRRRMELNTVPALLRRKITETRHQFEGARLPRDLNEGVRLQCIQISDLETG